MQQYYDLEINILSCLTQKPELMKETKLEDKYFIKHQQLWQFMKAFYKKYETFDLVLMFNVCKEKFKIIRYIEYLVDVEPIPDHFYKYQEQLIELYNQKQKEKTAINVIYELSNKLFVGDIELCDYINQVNKISKKINENK